MIATIKGRTLTPRIRCEKDRLEGVKRVNASRVQNVMVAFNAVKLAFEKELGFRQNLKDEVVKIVKSDIDVIKSTPPTGVKPSPVSADPEVQENKE